MTPKTDIVCLVHDQLQITQGFVKHLFENTQNFRLIFVDNGSEEKTATYLQDGAKEDKWILAEPGKNLGVIGGRNFGVKYIESDFFMNLDNDQYVQSGWLEKLFSLMDQGYDLVGPEAWLLVPPNSGGSLTVGGQVFSDRAYFPFKHCSRRGDKFSYIGCGGSLIKKEIYDTIGLFDERYNPAYFEDPHFCWQALQEGFKLGWCHNCPIVHLAHQTFNHQNLFDKNAQFIKSWMAFREKWHPYYPEPMRMV